MREFIQSDPAVNKLRAEQISRWEEGARDPLESLLDAHPRLSANHEAMLDLLYAEVLLREEYGEGPTSEEYVRRFPQLAEPLRRVFMVHQSLAMLESDGVSDAETDTLPDVLSDSMALFSTALLEPPRRHGAYEIQAEIGRGGMGVVYKARHSVTGRLAALKVIRADEATAAQRARFLLEAKAVAALSHPNIVQVYEVSAPPPNEGTPFVALEYVAGGNLAAYINGVPLPARNAARLLQPLAEAIAHAHERGIVHRDLKPANVLLQKSDDRADLRPLTSDLRPLVSSLCPKITDFGLAKQLDAGSGQTRTGDVLGSPSYMAPEQARGQTSQIGPAADIYSLGAILYEMLTGRPPFRGATILDTLAQVQLQEPVAPGRLNPSVPRDLETICLKCLHKDSSKRYPTSRDLADDLENYLNDRPIRARPIGSLERSLKWMKRRPAAAALLGVIALAAVALATGWASFTIQLNEQRQQAIEARHRAEEQAKIARRETREAQRQSERAAHLLWLSATAVDDIAISARGAPSANAPNGAVLFRLAAFYARASTTLATDEVLPKADRQTLADQYAASSVRLLNCSHRAGYFDPSREAKRQSLDNDPDFAILHARDDYRRFRQGLE